jgi:hypothetical protein
MYGAPERLPAFGALTFPQQLLKPLNKRELYYVAEPKKISVKEFKFHKFFLNLDLEA